MQDVVSLLGLAVVVFASTNVDDIFILLGYFADPKFRPRQIIAGQYLGIGALFLVSVLGSLISLVLAPAYVGLLGLVPILIGLKQLYDLASSEENSEDLERHGASGRILAVAAVTVANGGDNVGIYTPVFAIRSAADIAVIGLVGHRTIGAPIRRYGYKVVPFVLVGLGLFIMAEAGTFGLIAN